MATEALREPATKPPDGYPFHIGTRLVNHRDADGKIVGHHYEPLTEEDYLHPQEEDRFMSTDRHAVSLSYLGHALKIGLRDSPRMRTFLDHRIDWQIEGIEPHGPDAVVFDDFTVAYDDTLGTMPVKEVGATVVAVFEITSPSTRHIDFGDKLDEFIRVGIPHFIVIDAAAPNGVPVVMGMRLVRDRYRLIEPDAALGVFVRELGLHFRWQRDRLVAADAEGRDIPDPVELTRQLGDVRKLAVLETRRAEAAAKKADAQKSRADAEAARATLAEAAAKAEADRADALAAELAALKARLDGTK